MVLVDRAAPARLGELVRALLPGYPALEVLTNVLDLVSVPHGSMVVLAPRATDADWLNIQRPIFSRLSLRVILWCDAATTLALYHNAFDFFDWISHRYICPPAAALHGVRGIRGALAARAPGVVWTGGDLEACFQAARPGRALLRVSAARPYAELVEAVRQAGSAWVAWTDVDGPFRLRRVRWALAEAGRRGRAILVEPKVASPGWWALHGEFMGLREARARLAKAGAKAPGRLAALAGLEPEAVEIAAGLIERGVEEQAVERGMLAAADPGAALARMGEAKEGGPARRVFGVQRSQGDETEVRLRASSAEPEKWERLSATAFNVGDADVAVRWAVRAVEATGGSALACLLAGKALMSHGDYEAAKRNLKLAAQRAAQGSPLEANARDEFGRIVLLEGRYAEAETIFQEVLAQRERALGAEHPDVAQSLTRLAVLRSSQGRYSEAEALLRRAVEINKKSPMAGWSSAEEALRELAIVLQQEGQYPEAEALLRELIQAFEISLGAEHPVLGELLEILATNLRQQGRHTEAEALLQRAIAIQIKSLGENHLNVGALLEELAHNLRSQGKFAEAEEQLRRALIIIENALGPEHPQLAGALNGLAGTLQLRGNYAEAEACFRQALDIQERALGGHHPELCLTLMNLASNVGQQGRPSEGEPLALRALSIAQQTLGQHPDTSAALRTLAVLQWHTKNADAAETAREALMSYFQTLGPAHPGTREAAAILFSIGLQAWLQKDLEAFQAGDVLALGRLSSLVDMTEQVEAPNAELSARALLAHLLADVGQTQEALPHAERALGLALQTGHQEATQQLRELIDKLTPA